MHTWRGMSAGWFIAFEWLPYYTRLIHYNEPGWIETETMSKPDLRMSSTSKQQATTLTSICNMHEECVEMTEVWHCAPMSSVQSWDESEEWIWSLQLQSSKLDSIRSDPIRYAGMRLAHGDAIGNVEHAAEGPAKALRDMRSHATYSHSRDRSTPIAEFPFGHFTLLPPSTWDGISVAAGGHFREFVAFFPPISLLPLKCSGVFASESSFATHGDATPSDYNDIK